MVVAAEVRERVRSEGVMGGCLEFRIFSHFMFLAGVTSMGFLFAFWVRVVNGRWRLWAFVGSCGDGDTL